MHLSGLLKKGGAGAHRPPGHRSTPDTVHGGSATDTDESSEAPRLSHSETVASEIGRK